MPAPIQSILYKGTTTFPGRKCRVNRKTHSHTILTRVMTNQCIYLQFAQLVMCVATRPESCILSSTIMYITG